MGLSMTQDFSAALPSMKRHSRAGEERVRRITPQAGHALEILGHAIEYLTDEFVHFGTDMTAHNAQLEAVQLLMSLNREVYFECPQVPSLAKRMRALFNMRAA